ncbi:hypothetical protein HUJ04_012539 [Dendroctonus ponderosae]|nr:hypothetical protein HUJ04_012539 [Dendroctonus ponderosae]KAH1023308.1 hypothetical protein HUJ04_012539 [Dendroctonus ponderosae]KAH1023309.1 hypothetical protein HUJ04_012539 [Dendroctonus ponderosae]KAH1023310.1 hypothetical protein HUJ04_012539 [Dendroctonus ponderosae]
MCIRYFYIILLLKQLSSLVSADDVVGCGGFIQSHVPIDFSKVEVKLVTKQGIVKDRTNCAPNNGYYFVPLYDKGELKLKLSPPPGWSFTPKEISLTIDGTDPCSQGKDINFKFEGFGITGKVGSLGNLAGGPSGVTVKLSSKEGIRTTETLADGSFSFSPVFPGSYSVSISHPRWKLLKSSVNVEVTEGNTDLDSNSLLVQGYDVTGSILTAEGNPVQNTIIALFNQKKACIDLKKKNRNPMTKLQEKHTAVEGCSNNQMPNLSGKDQYLCHVTTGASGKFVFPVIPSGNYFVTPYYKDANIYYLPERIEFSIGHTSVQLSEKFQVIGFTISGEVANGKNQPISNAKIFLNGQEITKSDKTGGYKLEKLKVGTYRIKAEAENVKFDEVTVNIDTTMQKLPNLVPSAFKVCGKVISDKPQHVSVTHTQSSMLVETDTDEKTEFCKYLSPGQYEVSVKVGDEDNENGIQFFPLKHTIEVANAHIEGLVFSQLKSSFSGRLKCIRKQDCDGLYVILESASDNIIVPVQNALYSGSDIHPGVYEVAFSKNKICWKYSRQSVNINAEVVEIEPFIQTGYQLQFISSHDATITYKTLKEGKTETVPIGAGVTSSCLAHPGKYSFSISSCHDFGFNTVAYSAPSESNQITLNAQKHLTELKMLAGRDYGPIDLSIRIGNEEVSKTVVFSNDHYKISLMLKPSEPATITPKSDKLRFSPESVEIEGSSDCAQLGDKLNAVLGKVFQGQIQPPLPDVTISIENTLTHEIESMQTNSQGLYKFAPFDGVYEYKISAQKESYTFIGPDNQGNFIAQKLAEIIVEVLDENDQSPLEGVLLSLSGDQSFRRNLQTDSSGRITFHSLSASDYFLRPMMKEYRFEPSAKLIPVQEGQTINIQLTGKRVAFSAFGRLTTVNDDAFENVNIIASGIENCTGISEESYTDGSGAFRIRGLQPFCSFKVYVQVGNNQADLVERTSPSSILIKNINEDAKDLHIKVFRPVMITDVLLKIVAENVEHYRFLKVNLYRETTNPSLIYTTSIDNLNAKIEKNRNHGILVHLPTLQLDNNDYSIHLEPSHSLKGRPLIEYFNANSSFKYIEINFNPKTNVKEQPIKQTSVWAIVFIFVVLIVAYNIQIVLDLLKEHLNFNIENLSAYIPISSNYRSVNDYDNDIDQLVEDINNTRKHRQKKMTSNPTLHKSCRSNRNNNRINDQRNVSSDINA